MRLVSLLLGALALAPLFAQAPATFAELETRVLEVLPGGRAPDKADAGWPEIAAECRRELAAWPRDALSDSQWLDLHIMLQAFDRALAPAPPRDGKGGEPVGRERFEWELEYRHHLDLGAEDLVLLGETLLIDTERELAAAARAIEPGATWQELAARARADAPRTPADVLPMVRAQTLAAWRFCATSGLVTVPEVAEDIGLAIGGERTDKPYAWYQPGKLVDGIYLGTYTVTPLPSDAGDAVLDGLLGDLNRHWMQVVSLHEAIPGHHLQFAVASLIDSRVRGWGYTSVYVEGWGLYVEEAMYRAGFYTDPLTRIEQLRMRLWRAARVFIDASLHTGRIDRQEAERLLVERVLLAPDNARREVDRYLHNPTQPMSYAVGMRQIESLRRRYYELRGPAATERELHDRLLATGPIPLDLAAAYVLGERAAYDQRHP